MLSKNSLKKTRAAEPDLSQGLDLPAVQDNQKCSVNDLKKACACTGSQSSEDEQINETSDSKLTTAIMGVINIPKRPSSLP